MVLLAWMWAAFTLFHQGHDNHWARTPLEALESAAAVAVLVGPTRLTRFVLLAIFQAANLWWFMPEPTNHGVFALVVDLTIVSAAIVHAVSGRARGGFDGDALYRSVAPPLRVSVILLYVFATVAKVNAAFLNPALSCGTHHYAALRAHVAPLGLSLPDGPTLSVVAIVATLLIEGGIPVLLTFARTRPAGVVVALVFHYALGLNGFYDFSSMIYALLLLFTPDGFGALVERVWLRSGIHGVIDRARARPGSSAGIVVMLTAGVVVALVLLEGNQWRRMFGPAYAVWPLYGGGVMLLAVPALVQTGRRDVLPRASPLRRSAVLWAAPLLVVLDGVCPYIGLKTDSSFAMFSNLRTERGFANHLLIPHAAQPFGFQRDLVRIVESSDSMLARSARQHELVKPLRTAERGRRTGGNHIFRSTHTLFICV
jgi:hypothetical protein